MAYNNQITIHEAVKNFCAGCIARDKKTECQAAQCELFPFRDGQGCQCDRKFIRYEPQNETPDFNRIKNNG
jgi:hypothetical protein